MITLSPARHFRVGQLVVVLFRNEQIGLYLFESPNERPAHNVLIGEKIVHLWSDQIKELYEREN